MAKNFILDERLLKKNDLLINSSGVGTAGRVTYFDLTGDFVVDSHITIVRLHQNEVLPRYVLNIFGRIGFKAIESLALGQSGQVELTIETISNIKIPLPPKEIQEKIVLEVDALEQEEKNIFSKIERLKNDIAINLGEQTFKGKVSDLCEISKEKLNPIDTPMKEFYYLGLEHIESNTGKILIKNIEIGSNIQSAKNVFKKGDVLYGKLRPYLNKVAYTECPGICSTDILVLKTNVPLILKHILLSKEVVKQTSSLMKGVSLPRIKVSSFLNIKISIPSDFIQKEIISKIEKIETQITKLEKQLSAIPQQKEKILKKYLE